MGEGNKRGNVPFFNGFTFLQIDFQDRMFLKISGAQLKEWLLQFGRSSQQQHQHASAAFSLAPVPNIITCLHGISDPNFSDGTLNPLEKQRYLESLSSPPVVELLPRSCSPPAVGSWASRSVPSDHSINNNNNNSSKTESSAFASNTNNDNHHRRQSSGGHRYPHRNKKLFVKRRNRESIGDHEQRGGGEKGESPYIIKL